MLNAILHYDAPLSISIAPTSLDEEVLTSSGTTTGTFVSTVTGGIGAKTYLWTILSQAGTGTVSIASPTSANTQATYTGLVFTGAEVTATLRCTVTDAASQTASYNVSLRLEQVGLGSGGIP